MSSQGLLSPDERLSVARQRFGAKIPETRRRVRRWLDWRTYVRAAPVTSFAAMTALGYRLAPKPRDKTGDTLKGDTDPTEACPQTREQQSKRSGASLTKPSILDMVIDQVSRAIASQLVRGAIERFMSGGPPEQAAGFETQEIGS